ncbi:hypothetical protein, partial [Streptomyces sp. NPDC005091]
LDLEAAGLGPVAKVLDEAVVGVDALGEGHLGGSSLVDIALGGIAPTISIVALKLVSSQLVILALKSGP